MGKILKSSQSYYVIFLKFNVVPLTCNIFCVIWIYEWITLDWFLYFLDLQMLYSLPRVINRAMKNTQNCSSEFMNGHASLRFIVTHYGSAKNKNWKGGRSTSIKFSGGCYALFLHFSCRAMLSSGKKFHTICFHAVSMHGFIILIISLYSMCTSMWWYKDQIISKAK